MINIFVSKIPQPFDIHGAEENFKTNFPARENQIYLESILKRTNPTSKEQSLYALEILLRAIPIVLFKNDYPKLMRSPSGKPYFDGEPVHFSISHDKDIVCVAISSTPVGVDIQSQREILAQEKFSERFFSPSEVENIRKGEVSSLEVWTKKEAYAKLCDIPLAALINKDIPEDIFFERVDFDGFIISAASREKHDISLKILEN